MCAECFLRSVDQLFQALSTDCPEYQLNKLVDIVADHTPSSDSTIGGGWLGRWVGRKWRESHKGHQLKKSVDFGPTPGVGSGSDRVGVGRAGRLRLSLPGCELLCVAILAQTAGGKSFCFTGGKSFLNFSNFARLSCLRRETNF